MIYYRLGASNYFEKTERIFKQSDFESACKNIERKFQEENNKNIEIFKKNISCKNKDLDIKQNKIDELGKKIFELNSKINQLNIKNKEIYENKKMYEKGW